MGHSTEPGIACNCGTGSNLALPPTVTDELKGSHLKKANMILLEYARDAALLQSRAYDAVLRVVSEPCED
jgi:hypothetical protein